MVLLIVSIIIFAVLAIGIALFVLYHVKENDASKLWFLSTLGAGIAFVILIFGSFAKVSANNVGIVYDDRYGIVDKVYEEGFKHKSIFEHITQISLKNRDKFIQTDSQTNDGQYATFEISITYNIERENAPRYFRTVGGNEMIEDQLYSLIENSLQSSTTKYNIFDLLSEDLETCRVEFETSLRNALMEQYGITLKYATFKDATASPEIETILSKKATAEKQVEIAMKEAEAKLIESENSILIAQNKAKADKALADASAYAVKVSGEAEADAATAYISKINEMISTIQESTGLSYADASQLVLSIVFYDNWNGELPQTLTSDSLSSLIGSLIADKQNQTQQP